MLNQPNCVVLFAKVIINAKSLPLSNPTGVPPQIPALTLP